MAEVTLKKKITLRRKEEQAAFTFSGKPKVKLMWSSSTDLDLCLFFKKNDGSIYNPQIEMFAHFKTKSSFHKTKGII